MSKTNIADETARARKILSKNGPPKLNPQRSTVIGLTTDAQLGESAVIVVVGSSGTRQYTICRPIGITNLSATEDWTIIPSDDVKSTLEGRIDPNLKKRNLEITYAKHKLLLDEGYLVKNVEKPSEYFYPHDNKVSRTSHLREAKLKLDGVVKNLKQKLDSLPKKANGKERGDLHNQINAANQLVKHLDDDCRVAEKKIINFLKSPTTLRKLEELVPQTYRTLTGPFMDQEQVAIRGAKGKALPRVLASLQNALMHIDISPFLIENLKIPVEKNKQTQAEELDKLRKDLEAAKQTIEGSNSEISKLKADLAAAKPDT